MAAPVYGWIIGYEELKPHDLRPRRREGGPREHDDLEEVGALLGHVRIDTTQIYASIRPPQLTRAVSFYEDKAARMRSE